MATQHLDVPPDRAFDLIVVGAGSAGFSAAITGAELGARVALVGHGTIGGTCVNIGCVPSKALVRAAGALHEARRAARFAGLEATARVADWRAVVAQKNELVERLRRTKYADLLPAWPQIVYVEGPARLAPGGVQVGDTLLRGERIVIATGARPAVPRLEGLDRVPFLTSTTALDLDTLPRSLVVIGGGFIGVELAQVFARFGARVTIACRRRLLPDLDAEVGETLARHFEAEGLAVTCGVAYRAVARTASGVAVRLAVGGEERVLEAEHLLVAAGRTPNTERLGLREHGVATGPLGEIVVDDHLQTSRPGIYAAGDVTGRDQFVYMAAYGARLAATNALLGNRMRYDRRAMPKVVFTDPQVGSVGLTEEEARASGRDPQVAILPLDQVPRALVARDTRGLVKLVADRGTRRLLGAQIVAPEGGDSIQTAALAIRHGMTVEALAETIMPYLTTVESLRLAAQSFHRDVSRLSCCAG
jgi:mercury(II) reductase